MLIIDMLIGNLVRICPLTKVFTNYFIILKWKCCHGTAIFHPHMTGFRQTALNVSAPLVSVTDRRLFAFSHWGTSLFDFILCPNRLHTDAVNRVQLVFTQTNLSNRQRNSHPSIYLLLVHYISI